MFRLLFLRGRWIPGSLETRAFPTQPSTWGQVVPAGKRQGSCWESPCEHLSFTTESPLLFLAVRCCNCGRVMTRLDCVCVCVISKRTECLTVSMLTSFLTSFLPSCPQRTFHCKLSIGFPSVGGLDGFPFPSSSNASCLSRFHCSGPPRRGWASAPG